MEALAFSEREQAGIFGTVGGVGFEVGERDLCRNCWSPSTQREYSSFPGARNVFFFFYGLMIFNYITVVFRRREKNIPTYWSVTEMQNNLIASVSVPQLL